MVFSIACAMVNSVEQLHWLRLCDYLCYFDMVCELSVVDYYCLVGVFRLDALWFLGFVIAVWFLVSGVLGCLLFADTCNGWICCSFGCVCWFLVFVSLGGLGCMVLIFVLDLRADYVGCYVFGVWFGFPGG